MRPFLLAALNTEPEDASAALAGAVLRETLAKGGTPIARASPIPPWRRPLSIRRWPIWTAKARRCSWAPGCAAMTLTAAQAMALEFAEATMPVAADDVVMLAVPPWVARRPAARPDRARRIPRHRQRAFPDAAARRRARHAGRDRRHGGMDIRFPRPHLGHRLRRRRHRRPGPRGAGRAASGPMSPRRWTSPAAMPAWQIVKEKRATFAATPAQDARRPPAKTRWRNLFLAGDWTRTGLPATIEGALRSGETAAALALRASGSIVAAMNQLNPGEFAGRGRRDPRRHRRASWRQQRPDGHWVYELEADATIPAEYVLLVHYLAETPNLELERKIGVYLRRIQGAHGGWPLYHEGAFDISRDGEGLFRAQDDRRRYRCAAHGAGPRGDPRARRRHQGQCLHPHPAGAVWRDVVERMCRPCRRN